MIFDGYFQSKVPGRNRIRIGPETSRCSFSNKLNSFPAWTKRCPAIFGRMPGIT